MKFKNVLVLIFILLMLACVQTSVVRLGPSVSRPPVPDDQVVIYRTADKVPGKYEEIAVIHSKGEAGWTDEEQLYKAMRKKAGKLGANGIILDSLSEPSAGAKIAGAFLGTGAQRTGKVIAIYVYPEEKK